MRWNNTTLPKSSLNHESTTVTTVPSNDSASCRAARCFGKPNCNRISNMCTWLMLANAQLLQSMSTTIAFVTITNISLEHGLEQSCICLISHVSKMLPIILCQQMREKYISHTYYFFTTAVCYFVYVYNKNVRINQPSGGNMLSEHFNMEGGVLQSDIFSHVLFSIHIF